MSLSIDITDGQGLSNRVETTCQKHKGDTINHSFYGRSHLYSFTLPLGVESTFHKCDWLWEKLTTYAQILILRNT